MLWIWACYSGFVGAGSGVCAVVRLESGFCSMLRPPQGCKIRRPGLSISLAGVCAIGFGGGLVCAGTFVAVGVCGALFSFVCGSSDVSFGVLRL